MTPEHVLFMCVANSARSQLAEGIARALAPDGVRISSAGSAPTRVRPEAVEVLMELGIDASGQRSKSVDQIDVRTVDLVVTLCAEEVCPVLPGEMTRLHWPLPDPAQVEGSAEDRLESFRRTRDELSQRIAQLFAPSAHRGQKEP